MLTNFRSAQDSEGEIFLIFSVLHNVLQEIPGMYFPDRMSGDDLQSLHQ